MMNVLLESRAARDRRRGGTIVSIVVHTSIIVAVAAVTATRTNAREPASRPMTEIVYVEPTRRAPSPSDDRPARGSSTPTPLSTIAPRVPPIAFDFTAPPTTIPSGPLTTIDVSSDAGHPTGTETLVPGGAYPRGDAFGGSALRIAEVDRVASLLETVTPRYPERLRAAGVSGRVAVRFVIDTLGRVERDGIQLLASAHADFTAAVLAALEKMRFRPAEAAGRRVRMLVEMPFEFTLR
jgi:periplasmic protein TonB